jgi:hypothetical protein
MRSARIICPNGHLGFAPLELDSFRLGVAAAEIVRVKLEGAAKVGERYVGIAGVRDPYSVANIDAVIGWARKQVEERFGTSGYELYYTVSGRNGVMGALEPVQTPAHELGIVVQAVAPTSREGRRPTTNRRSITSAAWFSPKTRRIACLVTLKAATKK